MGDFACPVRGGCAGSELRDSGRFHVGRADLRRFHVGHAGLRRLGVRYAGFRGFRLGSAGRASV